MNPPDCKPEDVLEKTAAAPDSLLPESVLLGRRARQAEKELAQLKAERDLLEGQKQTLAEQISRLQLDQQLRQAAEAAGAVDGETVCLLLRHRLADAKSSDIPGLLAQLQKEKSWLFAAAPAARPARTAGVRSAADGCGVLRQAAGKAEQTGRLNDVQEYLRLRRQYK